jgi:translation initiation factor 2 alpha subunit (eIF-2alpha)
VLSLNDPKRIAASLKRSAERSRRRKSASYRSALSMLIFYINRAGKKLPASRRRTLEQAKTELKQQFGRE